MAVSSSSAKPIFYLGSFNKSTSLTIPHIAAQNTVSLRFSSEVADQLSGYDPYDDDNIYVLLKITFNGTSVYENSQYGWVTGFSAPTDPDLTIAVGSTDETVTINNYIPLVTDSSGNLSEGNYVVTAEFVYQNSDDDFETTTATVFSTAPFQFTTKEPALSYYYTLGNNATLSVTDSQSYVLSGTTATRDVEFVLYPPENRTSITSTVDNIQTASYSSFYSGGNEIRYTILIEYEFTNYIASSVEQKYLSFTVYNVDQCSLFECLENQYQIWRSASCDTQNAANAKAALEEATVLSQLIFNGLGCNSSELSSLIDRFKAVLDCDCDDCLSATPTLIGGSSVTPSSDIQTVEVTESTTTINLALGSTVYVNMNISGGGISELTATGIVENGNYRLIIYDESADPQTATFDSDVFEDNNGSVLAVTPSSTYYTILDFFAVSSSKLVLVSRNDS